MTDDKTPLSMADRARRIACFDDLTIDGLDAIGRIDPDCMFHPPDKDDKNQTGFEIRFADGSCLRMTRGYGDRRE
jgi:hypothetical protein